MNKPERGIARLERALFILGLLLLFPAAGASSLRLKIESDFFGFNNISVTFNNRNMTVDAGEFQVRYTGSYESGLWPAFCVDLNRIVYYGENNIDGIVSPETYADNGLYVEWLVDYALSPAVRPLNQGLSSAGAGLQLAIWKVLYDFDPTAAATNYNLGDMDGIFSYDTATTTEYTDDWYNGYLSRFVQEVENGFHYTGSGRYSVLMLSTDSRDTQDLITGIPEPTSMGLFAAGIMLGLAAAGRRRLPS